MRFDALFSALPNAELRGGNPEIAAICDDSREVWPGSLFVAVPGYVSDGHQHIGQALERGAAAVVLQRDHLDQADTPSVPFALLDDTRAGLAALAAAFHGFPERRLRVVGVTGTDGKTTTSYLINAVLEAAGARTGLLGTVDFKVGDRWESNNTRLTTPPAPEVQALLAQMAAADVRYAILESTSHGLELRRLDHCGYDVAVLTNLSPDHLDQHGTMEAYRAAKGMLFAMLDAPTEKRGSRYAVLNADDAEAGYFRTRTTAPALTYGLDEAADVRAEDVELGPFGARFRVRAPSGNVAIELPMPGLFNVSNALAAIAVGIREGIDEQTIAAALRRFSGVPGRMERIDLGQPFSVIVDYAHTGEALSKVLRTVRPATSGSIIAVFGSAGERGHTRRSGMASAAAGLADFVLLTDEDPRFEDPAAILEEMAGTLRANGRSEPADFVRVLDRQQAIAVALRRAKPGDLVLVAGKGHEQSIEARGTKIPWDDRAAVRSALSELGYQGDGAAGSCR
jgi:UDP-N-acetylmuramoyl-L-alanyl-D-glutamate--2,6-diaminopimelate ligase